MQINGITVVLHEKVRSGTDDFGAPVYKTVPVDVEDVLVSPVTADDIVTNNTIYGKLAVYQLAIPKGDTHNWENSRIDFFGKSWLSFGPLIEGIEENIPLRWNGKINVERYG